MQVIEVTLSLHSIQTFPGLHVGLKHIGEATDRSLYPCILQVGTHPSGIVAFFPVATYLMPCLYTKFARIRSYIYPHLMCTPPIKPCRWRRHFSPQTRINRFVFLNLPILSLVTHLGVTVSPHAPFPTGYVTLSAYDKSPPFRLSSSRNRGRSSISSPPCFRYMYSKHALVPKIRLRRFSVNRRTVGDIRNIRQIPTLDLKLPV